MKYYQHNLGDYAAATKHLSLLEHGVYRQLLDLYYGTEAPIPSDLDKVCRLIGAYGTAQRRGVEQVLNEFFEKNLSGWYNKRADAEIAKYKAKAEKAKKSASSRWDPMRTHSEGIATEVPTQSEGNANHKPITNNQEKKSRVVGADAPYAFDGKVIRLTHADFAKWNKTYHAIPDLRAELEVADAYYADKPPKKWYYSVSNWLKREHAKLVKAEQEARDERNRIY